ncbi:MAG: imidazole glycerol phosphate synthase cyclase subunit [Chitinophagaceae bacterium]|nr:imidazole glycerol phosphate synthase cyclase subunit [Chitinophagaceae bacterium]MCW5904045.1 imidazole glycerol phosphate synthase cyclase subunit [Chitinophagaceae bacterium]
MLKKRISANVIVRNGIVVQSINFKKYLPIGKPAIALEFLNQWGIDEIVLLDITAGIQNGKPDFGMVKKASVKCYVPLTVGGGINHLDHVKELMHCGADKISLNQATLHNKQLVSDTAHTFGNQCVVVSIDAVESSKGYLVYDHVTKQAMPTLTVASHAKQMEGLGAGEIFVNSVDRDGSYKGYDLNLINEVCDAVNLPVICSGGAKNANDFLKVLEDTNASAASAGNFFFFTEHSVTTTKAVVRKQKDVRLETFITYSNSNFDDEFRLLKKKDSELEDMLYVEIKKEVI